MHEPVPLSGGYCTLFNAVTDCITELDLIKRSWPEHPFLIRDLDMVCLRLARAQTAAENHYMHMDVDATGSMAAE